MGLCIRIRTTAIKIRIKLVRTANRKGGPGSSTEVPVYQVLLEEGNVENKLKLSIAYLKFLYPCAESTPGE